MKVRCLGLGILITCAVTHRAESVVVCVNVAQTNNVPDGQSWPTAFKTVREAIQAASNGDAVLVAAGTYFYKGPFLYRVGVRP